MYEMLVPLFCEYIQVFQQAGARSRLIQLAGKMIHHRHSMPYGNPCAVCGCKALQHPGRLAVGKRSRFFYSLRPALHYDAAETFPGQIIGKLPLHIAVLAKRHRQ
ncbi:hypothetical protein D3C81_1931260 [compost metagenome]